MNEPAIPESPVGNFTVSEQSQYERIQAYHQGFIKCKGKWVTPFPDKKEKKDK